jgi:tetratricopeptide (TPR) repeat protein
MTPHVGILTTLVLLAALPARPAPAAPESSVLIRNPELELPRQNLREQVQRVQEGRARMDDLVELYRREAESESEPRKAAIRNWSLGRLFHIQRRFREARAAYERALELWPAFPACYVDMSAIAEGLGDRRAALQLLEQALEVDPSYLDARNMLGESCLVQNRLDEAEGHYRRSLETDVNAHACSGLARVYQLRWKECYDEETRKELEEKALRYARACLKLEPLAPGSHHLRAVLLVDFGRDEEAIAAIEESCRSRLRDEFRVPLMGRLVELYGRKGDNEKLIRTLERLLENKAVDAQMKERIRTQIQDVQRLGRTAFMVWKVQGLMAVLRNEGISASDRRKALRDLIRFFMEERFLTDESLDELRSEVFNTIVRSIIDAPPKVTIPVLRFLREKMGHAALVRILVHFVYPHDDERRTPRVRVEAVRTIAAVADEGALPTLCYCLADPSGLVQREVDSQLARLCEVRSPVGEGLKPLTAEEIVLARRAWRAYFLGPEGAEQLAGAFDALRGFLDMDPQFNRSVQTKPIADHVTNVILLDNDMPFDVWVKAYRFLRDYLGKEFRAVERRGTPIEPSERPAIVKEIDEFFSGGTEEAFPERPPAAGGEEG